MSVQPFDIQSVCFISFYLFKTIPVGKFSSFTAILSPSAVFSGSREIADIIILSIGKSGEFFLSETRYLGGLY